MKIMIVGPGAIGSLWACQLRNAGHNVSVWGRDEQLYIKRVFQEQLFIFKNRQCDQLIQADFVLVTLKAWQVAKALPPILDKLPTSTVVILLHNGMGTSEALIKKYHQHYFINATSSHGAKKEGESIYHTGHGETHLGQLDKTQALIDSKQRSILIDTLNQAQSPVYWNSNMKNALWQKLAINCAINPLTAIHGCQNGQLDHSNYQPLIADLVNELQTVMPYEGVDIPNEEIMGKVYQTIKQTAANFSSMHQDIFYQRQTEIDYITGYLLTKAQQHALTLPNHQRLYEQIKQLENQYC